MTSERAGELLRLVVDNANGDFDGALSLPPEIYHSGDLLEREIQRLFAKGWMCVGRGAEMPDSGDYISFDIADQPVFVIRQRDGEIRAFPNVCLHRCSVLLKGTGHVSKVSCPYHSWTYDLDGQLVGAPFMQKTPGFDTKDYKLRALPCEIWEGFIYVSLDTDAVSPSARLSGLSAEVGDFRIADYVPVYEEEEVWNTNWKCLVENFMDSYHLHRVHANSFNKYSSFENVTAFMPGNDSWCGQYVQEDGGPHSVTAHERNTWLTGDKRTRTYVANIFPSHVIQLQPDLLWYLTIQPQGVDRVRIRWAVSIPAEFLEDAKDREAHIADEVEFLKQVNGEDKPAIEGVFRATAMSGATRGPLSWLERNCWDFGRYLARELSD